MTDEKPQTLEDILCKDNENVPLMTQAKIYENISKAMAEINPIGKNQTNVMQKFKYRGIDDVYNGVQPIMARHELFSVPEILEERTEERVNKAGGPLIYRILKIKFTMFTSDGSSVCGTVIGEGMDGGDKASNKAMAVAHKYFLSQVFAIPTADTIDPDGETHEVQPKNNSSQKQTVTKQTQSVTNSNADELKCPECKSKLLPSQNPDRKTGEEYYYCAGYKKNNCKYTYYPTRAKMAISSQEEPPKYADEDIPF